MNDVPPVGGTEIILVVASERAGAVITREMLESGGYTVLLAADGVAALSYATRHPGPIHLLLADDNLKGMPTPQLVERLRNLRPAVRVLLIGKPLSGDDLARTVREVLDAD